MTDSIHDDEQVIISSPPQTLGSDISVTGTNKVAFSFGAPAEVPAYNHGDRITLVIEAEVRDVAFPLFDRKYPGGGVVRMHKAQLIGCADVTGTDLARDIRDRLADAIDQQKKAREQAAGVYRLTDFIDDTFDDGLDTGAVIITEDNIATMGGKRVDLTTGEIIDE